jgi:hypothetical protein
MLRQYAEEIKRLKAQLGEGEEIGGEEIGEDLELIEMKREIVDQERREKQALKAKLDQLTQQLVGGKN